MAAINVHIFKRRIFVEDAHFQQGQLIVFKFSVDNTRRRVGEGVGRVEHGIINGPRFVVLLLFCQPLHGLSASKYLGRETVFALSPIICSINVQVHERREPVKGAIWNFAKVFSTASSVRHKRYDDVNTGANEFGIKQSMRAACQFDHFRWLHPPTNQ